MISRWNHWNIFKWIFRNLIEKAIHEANLNEKVTEMDLTGYKAAWEKYDLRTTPINLGQLISYIPIPYEKSQN